MWKSIFDYHKFDFSLLYAPKLWLCTKCKQVNAGYMLYLFSEFFGFQISQLEHLSLNQTLTKTWMDCLHISLFTATFSLNAASRSKLPIVEILLESTAVKAFAITLSSDGRQRISCNWEIWEVMNCNEDKLINDNKKMSHKNSLTYNIKIISYQTVFHSKLYHFVSTVYIVHNQ